MLLVFCLHFEIDSWVSSITLMLSCIPSWSFNFQVWLCFFRLLGYYSTSNDFTSWSHLIQIGYDQQAIVRDLESFGCEDWGSNHHLTSAAYYCHCLLIQGARCCSLDCSDQLLLDVLLRLQVSFFHQLVCLTWQHHRLAWLLSSLATPAGLHYSLDMLVSQFSLHLPISWTWPMSSNIVNGKHGYTKWLSPYLHWWNPQHRLHMWSVISSDHEEQRITSPVQVDQPWQSEPLVCQHHCILHHLVLSCCVLSIFHTQWSLVITTSEALSRIWFCSFSFSSSPPRYQVWSKGWQIK